jgi:hypothetical protein
MRDDGESAQLDEVDTGLRGCCPVRMRGYIWTGHWSRGGVPKMAGRSIATTSGVARSADDTRRSPNDAGAIVDGEEWGKTRRRRRQEMLVYEARVRRPTEFDFAPR